jgi:hypothetical protein
MNWFQKMFFLSNLAALDTMSVQQTLMMMPLSSRKTLNIVFMPSNITPVHDFQTPSTSGYKTSCEGSACLLT